MSARRIGVVAATLPRAQAIIAELGLDNAVPVSRRSGARGFALDALVIDEGALPLTEKQYDELLPTLCGSPVGSVYELRRHCGPPPF
ncbi:hypothetical protein SEA_TIERRA_2 [Mycobacterium phage Tierra]|uniref:Uncharacterized protein n=1 Tax=Mycobacterium phage Bryler TaxID=2653755 RepID=A0A5Q2WRV3_9CAUD|nr:hypothetical protein I5G79_gp02 [Mycobacterium phage Bryler]ASR85302.1 hypothetical protein SEA_PHRANK_2 [Mycobacterium phage Phrank]ASR85403.1 hypothetical protein SEA_CAIN_2 [Mycobacterium phage Cain]QGH80379.1 hypothetical protein SEA_BRYLER_2 [Mycobacterium phage Bryler]WNM68292.1 hypothetical protein SEA_TIERRA_2 [Mycobacterium phage Tierra]